MLAKQNSLLTGRRFIGIISIFSFYTFILIYKDAEFT